MVFTEHKRVFIEAQENTEVEMLVGQQVPHAVIMNSSDYGFGIFKMDDQSMLAYEEGLSKIDD